MTDISSLRQLRERVAGLTGASGKVDREIWEAFGCPGPVYGHYTASIDASLALVEQVLPGAEVEFSNLYHQPICGLPLNGDVVYHAKAPTFPLAILLALLDAKLQDTTP